MKPRMERINPQPSLRSRREETSSKMKILIALIICGLTDVTRAEVCTVNRNAINLALFGRVCQSSFFPSMPHPGPERGVDGISETNHTLFPCVLTKLEYEPYWCLDMEESYLIDVVYLVIRTDSCSDCMKGAEIRIGDSPDYKNPVCAVITDVSPSQPAMKFFCNGMQGRYVTIIHAERAGIVSFCEARVYNHIPQVQP